MWKLAELEILRQPWNVGYVVLNHFWEFLAINVKYNVIDKRSYLYVMTGHSLEFGLRSGQTPRASLFVDIFLILHNFLKDSLGSGGAISAFFDVFVSLWPHSTHKNKCSMILLAKILATWSNRAFWKNFMFHGKKYILEVMTESAEIAPPPENFGTHIFLSQMILKWKTLRVLTHYERSGDGRQ